MMVRQLAIDNRPKLGSFLTKLPLTIKRPRVFRGQEAGLIDLIVKEGDSGFMDSPMQINQAFLTWGWY